MRVQFAGSCRDLEKVIDEIKRVLAPQGVFLLITDIHRHPTTLEPTAIRGTL